MLSIIFLLIIILDQSSKYFASYFGFNTTLNTGISLNLLSSLSASLLGLLSIIFIVFVFSLFKKDWLKYPIASVLFFGGAVSNIIDRIIFGGVRDWLGIPFTSIDNNLADWFIFVGLGMFLVFQVKDLVRNN